jgi:hypothetical protein
MNIGELLVCFNMQQNIMRGLSDLEIKNKQIIEEKDRSV